MIKVSHNLTNGFKFEPRKCSMTYNLQATSNKFSEKLKMAAFSIRKRPGYYLVWGHNTAFLERREYLQWDKVPAIQSMDFFFSSSFS